MRDSCSNPERDEVGDAEFCKKCGISIINGVEVIIRNDRRLLETNPLTDPLHYLRAIPNTISSMRLVKESLEETVEEESSLESRRTGINYDELDEKLRRVLTTWITAKVWFVSSKKRRSKVREGWFSENQAQA
jgi:hypothetical protein